MDLFKKGNDELLVKFYNIDEESYRLRVFSNEEAPSPIIGEHDFSFYLIRPKTYKHLLDALLGNSIDGVFNKYFLAKIHNYEDDIYYKIINEINDINEGLDETIAVCRKRSMKKYGFEGKALEDKFKRDLDVYMLWLDSKVYEYYLDRLTTRQWEFEAARDTIYWGGDLESLVDHIKEGYLREYFKKDHYELTEKDKENLNNFFNNDLEKLKA